MTPTHRHGTFSSSNIWKLMTSDRSGKGFGAPALKYIKEKRYERKLGRELHGEVQSRATSWGTFVQHRVITTHGLLDAGCKATIDQRRAHPSIPAWTGAEDYLREDAIGEVKCFELLRFCSVMDVAHDYELLKEEESEIFWQLVSNCALHGWKKAELCLYVPYQKELSAIRKEAKSALDAGDESVRHIAWNRNDNELPFLIEGGGYKNLNLFQYDIKQEDVDLLESKVKMANEKIK